MSVSEKSVELGDKLSEHELCPDDLLKGQEMAFARDIERLHKRASEFLTVACPACDQRNTGKIFEKFGFTFQSCANCATIYMSPRPSPAVLGDYYANSENYSYWAKHIFPASEAVRREKIHTPWLNRVVGFCERHAIRQGTLLEIGPGFGTFAAVATQSRAFERVIAIEPTPEMAAACRSRGVDVIEQRIEDVGDEVGSVDVAVAFEVIEHLFDPKIFLKQCARLLHPGGLLVVSCPNGLGFDISMLGAKALAVDAEHVNLFNPGALTQLLKRCGFDVLEATTPGRLDAEFVREAALKGEIDLSHDAFLMRVLIEEWDRLGWSFQQFLAENGLSSHMWVEARRNTDVVRG
jgi:SAM-dependent methyltransferase